jgi:hypothetical protein
MRARLLAQFSFHLPKCVSDMQIPWAVQIIQFRFLLHDFKSVEGLLTLTKMPSFYATLIRLCYQALEASYSWFEFIIKENWIRFCSQLLAKAAVPPPSSSGSGDMGYAGSAGLQNQYYASNNTPCGYICYGFGQFDGQGSGHDFSGNVSFLLDIRSITTSSISISYPQFLYEACYIMFVSHCMSFFLAGLAPRFRLGQQRWRWPLPHLRGLPPAVKC